MENMEEKSVEYWKDMENRKEKTEKIWKIRQKIVKRFGKYRRKASWKEKIYWKCGRKLWNDMENMEEK